MVSSASRKLISIKKYLSFELLFMSRIAVHVVSHQDRGRVVLSI